VRIWNDNAKADFKKFPPGRKREMISKNVHGKNDFAERSKILAEYKSNFIELSK